MTIQRPFHGNLAVVGGQIAACLDRFDARAAPLSLIEENKKVFNQKKKPILERINQQIRLIK